MGFTALSQRMFFTCILVITASLLEFSSPDTHVESDSGLCPRSWEKAYIYGGTIGLVAVCLKYFNISATWDEASIKCKSENSNIIPPIRELRNALSLKFSFRRGVKLWSGLHVRGGGLIMESFPPYTAHAGIFNAITLLSDGTDLNLKCIVFESGSEKMEYTLRNCSDATAFYCFTPIHQFSAFQCVHYLPEGLLYFFECGSTTFSFKYWRPKALSFCPYNYVGDFYFPKCYRYVYNEESLHQAKQKCSPIGALAKFNTSDPIDKMIALKILESADTNRKVWFQNLETAECSLLNMNLHNESLWEIASSCESRNTYICEAHRTPEGVRDITVKAKFITTEIDYGNEYSIACDVSSKLNNYEDIRIYQEKKQVSSARYRYSHGDDVYYIDIMTSGDFNDIPFWVSAVQDIGEYRCEVYSLSRGLIASDSVYTDVCIDQVIKYVGTFEFEPKVPELVYIPFNFGYSTFRSGMTTFTDCFEEMLNYTEMELNFNLQTINTTLFLKGNLTEISNYGQRAEFSLFVIPSVEKVLTTQDEITLRNEILAIIQKYTSNHDPGFRKRRDTGTFQIDHDSVKLFSTVACSSDVYISVLDTNIRFVPVQLGDVILSAEVCITDLKPLVSAKCMGGEGKRTYAGEINVNQKCVFDEIPQLRDDRDSIFRDLSKIPVNKSNADKIAAQTGTLMMVDEVALTTSDIIYTGVILNRIAQVRDVDESTLDSVVHILYNVLEVPQERLVIAQEYGSAANRILESFERISSNTLLNNSTYTRLNERFAVYVRDIIPTEEPVIGMKLDYSSNGVISNDILQTFGSKTNINVGEIDVAIVLSESVIKGRNNTRLVLQVYADTSLFITRKQNRRYATRGKVVAATVLVDGVPIRDLGANTVKSIFTPTQTDDNLLCGFWNYSIYQNSGGWATDGCMLKNIEDGRYVCECDHLTNFAILVDISGQDNVIDQGNTLALSIITIFGLALSLLGLGLTIISFLLFKNMRKGRGQQTIFNLAVAMVCYIIVFLAGSEQTQSYGGCITVAVLLHYFILAAFMWMLVEGVLQYLRFVKVLGTYIPNFMWKAAISAWGFPLIPVIIVLAVNYDSYRGGNSYCWMDRTPFFFAFLLPVCLILSANFIIFGLVLKNILHRPKGLQSNQSQRKQAMMSLRAGVAVLVVLGLTWLFGFLAISGARLTFLYIFTILNVLQGFLIFILFVAREKQFLKNWETLCCKKKGSMYRPYSFEDSKANPATKMNRYSCKSTSISNMDHESKDDNGETTMS